MTKVVPFTPPLSPTVAALARDAQALERLAPDLVVAMQKAMAKTVIDITAMREQERRAARRRR